MDHELNEGAYVASKGFPFPLPIALVRINMHETNFPELLEGTLVKTVEAFDIGAIAGFRFETAIVAWSDFALNDDSALKEDTRRRLVDWINLEVTPRTRAGRRPIWL